ncbi:MAG: hypothetical protein M3Q81_03375 [bacterium]|nr:hypothetical protein [bacterium]
MSRFQAEITGLKHKQQLLWLLVFSLVTIVVWVSISLITSQTSTKTNPLQQQLAEPLNPSINIDVITELENKKAYTKQDLARFPLYTLRTPERRATTPQPATEERVNSSALNILTTSDSETTTDVRVEATEQPTVLDTPVETPSETVEPSN